MIHVLHMQNIKDLLNKENKQLVKINALLSLIVCLMNITVAVVRHVHDGVVSAESLNVARGELRTNL